MTSEKKHCRRKTDDSLDALVVSVFACPDAFPHTSGNKAIFGILDTLLRANRSLGLSPPNSTVSHVYHCLGLSPPNSTVSQVYHCLGLSPPNSTVSQVYRFVQAVRGSYSVTLWDLVIT